MLAYTCKPLAGTDYALTTDSDVFVYDVASGLTQNICKPRNFGLEGRSRDQSRSHARLRQVSRMVARRPAHRLPFDAPAGLRVRQSSVCSSTTAARANWRTSRPEFDYNALNVVWGERRHALVRGADRGHAPALPPAPPRRQGGGRHPRRPRHQDLHDGRRAPRGRTVHDLVGRGVLRGESRGRRPHENFRHQRRHLRAHPHGERCRSAGCPPPTASACSCG